MNIRTFIDNANNEYRLNKLSMIIKIYLYIFFKIQKINNLKKQESTDHKLQRKNVTEKDFEIYYNLLDENRLATSTEVFFIRPYIDAMCSENANTDFCKSYLRHYLRPMLKQHMNGKKDNIVEFSQKLLDEISQSGNYLFKHKEKEKLKDIFITKLDDIVSMENEDDLEEKITGFTEFVRKKIKEKQGTEPS